MLWLAIHFPALSLEAFEKTLTANAQAIPVALLQDGVVSVSNTAAHAHGVRAGVKRATALALLPGLLIGQADAARDAAALTGLAHSCLAFTPNVALAGDDCVLMEVAASLAYFKGLDALIAKLNAALAPHGHTLQLCSAPTAHGAWVLARAKHGLHATDERALKALLTHLPAWLIGPAKAHWDTLQNIGVTTLGDLLQLPRSGVTRRFGAQLLDELDRALGIKPDPRIWLAAPTIFTQRLELFARADSTEQLLFAARRLLTALTAWLSARHAMTRGFELKLLHEGRRFSHPAAASAKHKDALPMRGNESIIGIALAEPSRDLEHLSLLLRERLAKTQLAAPTLEIELHCADIVSAAPPNDELFPTAKTEEEGLTRLIERLQMRLGTAQVHRLLPVQDYRPEAAYVTVPVGEKAPAAALQTTPEHPQPAARRLPAPVRPLDANQMHWLNSPATKRPVWLLREPQSLQQRRGKPFLNGNALELIAGPERIDTGWWTGELAERDYFIARDVDDALLWVFRSRGVQSRNQWFLQGRFG
jgi:protein ImuB